MLSNVRTLRKRSTAAPQLALVREHARKSSIEAIDVILSLMRDSENDAVKLKAAEILLDKAFGPLLKEEEANYIDLDAVMVGAPRIESIKDMLRQIGYGLVPSCSKPESSLDATFETIGSYDE